MPFKIATFCSSVDHVISAIDAGADHLILEDSKLSIRSFSKDFAINGFEKIQLLADIAREKHPNIELSFNCDLLAHHHHFSLIKNLISTLKQAEITHVRVQDPGLIVFFKENYPESKLTLATETGNQNTESIAYYATQCEHQSLCAEIPLDQLKHIQNTVKSSFEIFVHGPILLQYSFRRFMEKLYPESEESLAVQAEDLEYPGRAYRFYDNPHGHFMYAHFDRCVLKNIEQLKSLDMDWLIDARGESLTYMKTAITLFAKYRNTAEPLTQCDWEQLVNSGQRPFKPGFFLANKTDQDREDAHSHKEDPKAVVLDSIPDVCFTVEIKQPLQLPASFTAITPKGKDIPLNLENGKKPFSEELEQVFNPGDLVIFPWKKNMVPKTRLY